MDSNRSASRSLRVNQKTPSRNKLGVLSHTSEMTLFHTLPCLLMQLHILRQHRMYACHFFIHALRDPPNRKMRIRRGTQLTEREGLPQVELSQHTAIKSVGDDILRNIRIELI